MSRAHPPKSSRTAMRLAWVRQAVRHPMAATGTRCSRGSGSDSGPFVSWSGGWVPVDHQGDVPRAIRHQHWSVVFVPLMWAAVCGDRECPALQWLRADHPSSWEASRCQVRPPCSQGGTHCERQCRVGASNLEKICPSGYTTRVRSTKVGCTFLCTSPGENSPWCSNLRRALHSPRISVRAYHVAGMPTKVAPRTVQPSVCI